MNIALFGLGIIGLCLLMIPAIILAVLIVSMRTNHNGLSMLSLISGILGFCFLPVAGSIAAVVSGNMAMSHFRTDPQPGDNQNLAQVGVILGWIGIGLGTMAVAALIFLFVVNTPFGVYPRF